MFLCFCCCNALLRIPTSEVSQLQAQLNARWFFSATLLRLQAQQSLQQIQAWRRSTRIHRSWRSASRDWSRIYIYINIYIYIISSRNMWLKKKSDCTPKMEKFGRKNSGAPKFAPEPWGQTCQVFIHHQLEAHWKHRKKSCKTHRQDTFRRKRYASVSCHGSDFQDFAGRPATSSSYNSHKNLTFGSQLRSESAGFPSTLATIHTSARP